MNVMGGGGVGSSHATLPGLQNTIGELGRSLKHFPGEVLNSSLAPNQVVPRMVFAQCAPEFC